MHASLTPAAKRRNTSAVLQRAAILIEENGWVQGQSMAATGEFCMGGAIAHACYILSDAHGWDAQAALDMAVDAATDAVRHEQRGFTIALEAWNDQCSRTAEQVCAVLRTAAANVAPQRK